MPWRKRKLIGGALLGVAGALLAVKTALSGALGAPAQQPLEQAQGAFNDRARAALASSGALIQQGHMQLEAMVAGGSLQKTAAASQTVTAPARSTASVASHAPGTAILVEGPNGRATLLTPALVRRILREAAIRHGLDPRLVLALAYWESGWDQSKVSVAGATGLMQVEPDVAATAGPSLLGRAVDVSDPYDNADIGCAILREDLDHYGDPVLALAAYYEGPTALEQNGLQPDSEQYAQGVLSLASQMSG